MQHLSKFNVAVLIYDFLKEKLCQTLFRGKIPSTFLHLNAFSDV